MKQFSCGELIPGCTARFQAQDDAGILGQVAEHARRDHGMTTIPDGLVEQVKAYIIQVSAA